MRYSTEPKYRYSFLSFARKFGAKYGKKSIDAAKAASKWVVQKTVEAAGDLIVNKIADKITSLHKTKSKEEDERQKIYIPPEKRQQIIDDLRLFWHHTKMGYQKIINLLDTTPNEMPIFITEKWIEVHGQSGNAESRYTPKKKIMFKTSMLRSDLCDFSNAYIIFNGTITVEGRSNNSKKKKKIFSI